MSEKDIELWKFTKFSDLDGDTVAQYAKGEQRVQARSRGLELKNVEIESHGELEVLAKVIGAAWQKHEALRKCLLDKLMGKA